MTYISRKLKAIKEAATDAERRIILDRIYYDGFEDGITEGKP